MSDLFGNHIVGFPTRRLIYNRRYNPGLCLLAAAFSIKMVNILTDFRNVLLLYNLRSSGKKLLYNLVTAFSLCFYICLLHVLKTYNVISVCP